MKKIPVHYSVSVVAENNLYASIFCTENAICFFTSAAYIQVHFRLDFIMEANTLNPNQMAPLRAV